MTNLILVSIDSAPNICKTNSYTYECPRCFKQDIYHFQNDDLQFFLGLKRQGGGWVSFICKNCDESIELRLITPKEDENTMKYNQISTFKASQMTYEQFFEYMNNRQRPVLFSEMEVLS